MKRIAALATLLSLVGAASATLTPIYFWELRGMPAQLSKQPSTTDLVNGFTSAALPGALSNQVMNESAYGYADEFGPGIIDPTNQLYSMLMYTGSLCLDVQPPGIGQNSDGFLPGLGGHVGQFTDGIFGGALYGILRDYARYSLVVRFGFAQPTDIGKIRVFGGNILNRDGRTFHHYDIYASTDGLGAYGTFFPVALGVKTGPIGSVNSNLWSASMTEVSNFDGKTLVAGCTDLRILFYCVSNTQSLFTDPYQGTAQEDPVHQVCQVEPGDVDGRRKAFEASIIREIDVFPPGFETPWGDIDYDGDRDMVDAAAFQRCFAGSTTAGGCFRFDYDENAVINVPDFATFALSMTGPR